ncbi:DUF2970 domain-containing protein [Psychrobium sp. 1_MG-2023]|nr:DUF2970 domain-containing protein [Psychrobium sp. 1_MG-2023]MDP2561840.1 DUF2970 domain-containing protein [Psychrobium sp. 1_MG-2023]PKF55789.1 hypothetical protein CW748_11645 [Alteromonadales bacterium alter-6D02]
MNKKKPSILQVVFSVFAALVGIQSDRNRQRDFTQGHIVQYIIAGVLITICVIAFLIFIVSRIVP